MSNQARVGNRSMDSRKGHSNGDRSEAPITQVPTERIVTVEHPCMVQNFDRGFKSLGGEAQLKHILEHHVGDSKLSSKQNQLPEPVAGVSFRPNDPFAKKLTSVGVETQNVLVKITLPKRTGRKRKRGSDQPFVEPNENPTDPTSLTAPELLQRMQDNQDSYSLEPVGMLRETHRFRSLPDFQLHTAHLPIMRELRTHAMETNYDTLKEFNIDLSPGCSDAKELPAPPSFASSDMPHKYEYQQASGIVFVSDGQGNVTSKNIGAPQRRLTWGLPPDIDEIPQGPPPHIRKRNPTGEQIPRAIKELEKLLAERPLVTKRVALNALPPISESIFREATQYVGYSFKAGPWRDSLIRYGVDPRKDPQHRFYQTLMFQLDKEAFKLPSEVTSTWARTLRYKKDQPLTHIFDGKSITANGKTWQICDITDPIVHDILQTDQLRTECDVYQWGWYHNGTIAKTRTIMKDKMRYLFAEQAPPEEDYKPLAALPHLLGPHNMQETILSSKIYGQHVTTLCHEVRNIAKTGEGARSVKARRPDGREIEKGENFNGAEAKNAVEGVNDADIDLGLDDDGGGGNLDDDDNDDDAPGDFDDPDGEQEDENDDENDDGRENDMR